MLVANIIFIIIIQLVISTLENQDWSAGYTCPPYCEVDHEHIVLDLQLSSENKK